MRYLGEAPGTICQRKPTRPLWLHGHPRPLNQVSREPSVTETNEHGTAPTSPSAGCASRAGTPGDPPRARPRLTPPPSLRPHGSVRPPRPPQRPHRRTLAPGAARRQPPPKLPARPTNPVPSRRGTLAPAWSSRRAPSVSPAALRRFAPRLTCPPAAPLCHPRLGARCRRPLRSLPRLRTSGQRRRASMAGHVPRGAGGGGGAARHGAGRAGPPPSPPRGRAFAVVAVRGA